MKKIIDPIVKKDDAIEAAGGNANRLAKALGINRASVHEWGENLPPLRAWQAVNLFPQLKTKHNEKV